MKAKILTNTRLRPEWLEELNELVDWKIEVETTKEKLPSKLNPYFGTKWGDFGWMRNRIPMADIRCFCTTSANLKAAGITGHIGLYDLTDSDSKLDFYIGLPKELDKRAKRNGFRSNFAWMVIHEYLHGEEQQNGTPDRVHAMEEQGRLKELLQEHNTKYSQRMTIMSLLTSIKNLLTKPKGLQPLVKRSADAVVNEMKRLGYDVMVFQGYRSIEEQNALYAQGRTAPGSVITNAKGGDSLHNYGVAVDIVFVVNGRPSWSESHPWSTLGKVGKKQGFEWGGDWTGFVDRPHLEMTLGYSLDDFKNNRVNYSNYV